MKIVFVTGDLIYNSIVVEHVLGSKKAEVSAIFVGDFLIPKKSLLAGLITFYRRTGLRYTAFKVIETAGLKLIAVLRQYLTVSPKTRTMNNLAKTYEVPLYKAKDINSPETVKLIKQYEPDLLVSMLPQWIGKKVTSIPKMAAINIHPALLPDYRGLAPYFWPLYNEEKYSGVTVHHIADKIDKGDILAKQKFTITPEDTVQTVYYKSIKHGAKLLLAVIEMFRQDGVKRELQPDDGKYYKWPTVADIRKFKQKGGRLLNIKDLFSV